MFARENFHDESFIRQYLNKEDCYELNLFTYSKNKVENIQIDEVSDEDDWKNVKNNLIKNVGVNSIPKIYIDKLNDGILELKHDHDGRNIDLEYAEKVVEKISVLWNGVCRLVTKYDGNLWLL